MNIQNPLNTSAYHIGKHTIQLLSSPDVWNPYSATEMLSFMTQLGHLKKVRNKTVLDLGTGTGIIGIACGLAGAKEVVLSDYSKSATELALKNAQLNKVNAQEIQSDCFQQITGKTFDIIVSNPPVQPWLFTNTTQPDNRQNSACWNEAGNNGRLVLDALIKNSSKYLNKGGLLITSSSSRHGHQQTIKEMSTHWGANWNIVAEVEHSLDTDYHQPYINSWLQMQSQDMDLRIYQKDADGHKFACHHLPNGHWYLITEVNIQNKPTPVKLVRGKQFWQVLNAKNELIDEWSFNDQRIPGQSIDEQWYYQYFIITAEKK